MYIEIDSENPEPWLLSKAVQHLKKGSVVCIPTDTVYALAASIYDKNAIKRIYALKKINEKKPLSIIVKNFSMASQYTNGIPNYAFKIFKKALPGPYTFIFQASKEIPKLMLKGKRKTIGIRMPDEPICQMIMQELDFPLLVTSLKSPDGNYFSSALDIEDYYDKEIDVIVDSGPIESTPSTIVDLTGFEPEVIRQGKGDIDILF